MMTIKEISGIANVDERTVQRWTKSAGDKMSSINDKMSASSSRYPADFTLPEVIAIIRAGGNDTLADLLAENAKKEDQRSARLPRSRSGLSGAFVDSLIRASEKGLLTRYQFQEALGVTPEVYAVAPKPQTTMLGLPVNPEAQALASSLMDGINRKEQRQVHAIAQKAIANAASREAIDKLNGKLSFGGTK